MLVNKPDFPYFSIVYPHSYTINFQLHPAIPKILIYFYRKKLVHLQNKTN